MSATTPVASGLAAAAVGLALSQEGGSTEDGLPADAAATVDAPGTLSVEARDGKMSDHLADLKCSEITFGTRTGSWCHGPKIETLDFF